MIYMTKIDGTQGVDEVYSYTSKAVETVLSGKAVA